MERTLRCALHSHRMRPRHHHPRAEGMKRRMEQEGWEMTATEELRRLLDGHGAECFGHGGCGPISWRSGGASFCAVRRG